MLRLAYAAALLFITVISMRFIGLTWLFGSSGEPLWNYLVDGAQVLGFGFGIYAIWLTYSDRILRESPHLVLKKRSRETTLQGIAHTTSNESGFIENIGLGSALDVILEYEEVKLFRKYGSQNTPTKVSLIFADPFPPIGVDKEVDLTGLLGIMKYSIEMAASKDFLDGQPKSFAFTLRTKLMYKDRGKAAFYDEVFHFLGGVTARMTEDKENRVIEITHFTIDSLRSEGVKRRVYWFPWQNRQDGQLTRLDVQLTHLTR
jgi:hypothetical protein